LKKMNEKTDLNIDKLQRDIYNLTQKKWGIKLNLGWGIKLNLDIKKRRSERTYSGEQIELQKLADLLHFSLGITGTIKGLNDIELTLRAYPSAGALYPIEAYIIVFNVKSLDKGVYHYNVNKHLLELIEAEDHKEHIAKICLAEDIMQNANVLIILTAIFKRVTIKYGIRGYRFCLMEAGIVAQNTTLMAESLGLGSCMLGGFYDDEIHKLLKIDGVNEAVVNVMTVGQKVAAGR